MLELAVTISALAFVLKCLKFIWKVEQDRQEKDKKKPPTTEPRRQLKLKLNFKFYGINRLLGFLFIYYTLSWLKNQALLKFCLQNICRQIASRSYLLS